MKLRELIFLQGIIILFLCNAAVNAQLGEIYRPDHDKMLQSEGFDQLQNTFVVLMLTKSGMVGTGDATVDRYPVIKIVASVDGLIFILPEPLIKKPWLVAVHNIGSVTSFTMYDKILAPGSIGLFYYSGKKGDEWIPFLK